MSEDTMDTQPHTTAPENGASLLEVKGLSKYFGSVIAVQDISMFVRAGEVTCLLGDNGAGKSTLIKMLSGVYTPDAGEYLFDNERMEFSSPRDALSHGIATVYQDLAMIPLLSIWRNFFLGSEPTKGWGPFRRYNIRFAKKTTREEMSKMGIDIRNPDQPVGTLSGGERQSVAIARAVYFGARVLILDEPTAALGVKQAGVVLRYIVQAKQRGIGVIFITHNPHHAYPVGDHFVILRRGRVYGDYAKKDIALETLVQMMAGGEELENLAHELERAAGPGEASAEMREAARTLVREAAVAEAAESAVSTPEAPAPRPPPEPADEAPPPGATEPPPDA
jgi:simple sugar transport system ATP-binding protein